MKKWQIIVPVCAAAAGAAAVLAMSKKGGDKPAGAAAPKKKEFAMKDAQVGTYSFVSGFRDAMTVDVSMKYDAANKTFAVIEECFPADSSDSHVAVVMCDDYNMQLEYAGYYQGDDFAALEKEASEKYKEFAKVSYGANEGFVYTSGDDFCLCFPANDDPYSYILITIIRVAMEKKDFVNITKNPEMCAMLSSMEITRK